MTNEPTREPIDQANDGYYQITQPFTSLEALNAVQRRVGRRVAGKPFIERCEWIERPGQFTPTDDGTAVLVGRAEYRTGLVYTLTYWTTDEEQATLEREQANA